MKQQVKQFLSHNPTRTISLSFFLVIVLGTFLLCLPISNQIQGTSLLNHLFVATSATCVTGLVPVVVAEQYTLFGQIIILMMIQIGGLGFITLLMIFFVILKKRLSFTSRILMSEAINKSNLDHLNEFVSYIIRYTFKVELLGAIGLFVVFIQDYSFPQALYYSVFHSISAFCNAGFDVLGSQSLMNYASNPWFLFVIGMLIIMGGIGFLVAKEIEERLSGYIKSHDRLKKWLHSFSLHTKLVISMSLSLIVVGAVLVFLMEKDNPQTLGNLSLFDQIVNSIFQSVTYRTAGFASFNQGGLTESSKLIACFIMLVGGSPAGTAGGMKTVTIATLFLAVRATLKGEKEAVAFSKTIRQEDIMRALCVICISLVVVVMSSIVLCMVEPFNMIDLLYEGFSAFATVGLTCGITPSLSLFGKVVIILLMFIGRIGPVAMMLTLMKKSHHLKNEIKYPKGDILVG